VSASTAGNEVTDVAAPEAPIDRSFSTADLGRPIRGPRALTEDWNRFWHLTYHIARNEWKLRFFGSALGYLWQLMRPLLFFSVLYFFFTKVGRVNDTKAPGSAYYGIQLLGSIVLFTFFAEATAGAVRSVVDRENFVRKIQFPRLAIPLAVVLVASFNLALNLLVVLGFALASGVHPMLSWLEIPLILLVLIVFSTGVAMLLSAMFVYFRDIQPIWDVLSQILFYASPVILTVETVLLRLGPTALHAYMCNPLAVVFQQFRHAVVTHQAPSAAFAIGGTVYLLIPIGLVLLAFAIGFYVFNRTAPYVAENL